MHWMFIHSFIHSSVYPAVVCWRVSLTFPLHSSYSFSFSYWGVGRIFQCSFHILHSLCSVECVLNVKEYGSELLQLSIPPPYLFNQSINQAINPPPSLHPSSSWQASVWVLHFCVPFSCCTACLVWSVKWTYTVLAVKCPEICSMSHYYDLYWSYFNEIHIKMLSRNKVNNFQWFVWQNMEVKKIVFGTCEAEGGGGGWVPYELFYDPSAATEAATLLALLTGAWLCNASAPLPHRSTDCNLHIHASSHTYRSMVWPRYRETSPVITSIL